MASFYAKKRGGGGSSNPLDAYNDDIGNIDASGMNDCDSDQEFDLDATDEEKDDEPKPQSPAPSGTDDKGGDRAREGEFTAESTVPAEEKLFEAHEGDDNEDAEERARKAARDD